MRFSRNDGAGTRPITGQTNQSPGASKGGQATPKQLGFKFPNAPKGGRAKPKQRDFKHTVELTTPSGHKFVLCGDRDPGEVAAEMLLDANARIEKGQR